MLWSLWQPLVGSSPYLLIPGTAVGQRTWARERSEGCTQRAEGIAADLQFHPTSRPNLQCTCDTPDGFLGERNRTGTGPLAMQPFRSTRFGLRVH